MKAHAKYLWYVLRHKWFVFLACWQMGIPLAGLVHDWTKFLPVELLAYAEWFYGGWRQDEYNGESGAPEGLKLAYDYAWNHHMKANPHHWQYWIMVFDSGEIKTLPMPDRYRREMLADWHGAGRAITGKEDTKGWYLENKQKIKLHPETRQWIEEQLGLE